MARHHQPRDVTPCDYVLAGYDGDLTLPVGLVTRFDPALVYRPQVGRALLERQVEDPGSSRLHPWDRHQVWRAPGAPAEPWRSEQLAWSPPRAPRGSACREAGSTDPGPGHRRQARAECARNVGGDLEVLGPWRLPAPPAFERPCKRMASCATCGIEIPHEDGCPWCAPSPRAT